MTPSRRLKQLLDRLFPRAAAVRRAARSRRRSHEFVSQQGYPALDQRLGDAVGMRVLTGPFAGMRLTQEALREHAGPCLLGTYEAELHPWLDRLLRRRYAQYIDVGSKFGYYAVGLARRDPDAPSVAFDIDPWARMATREVAAANGVTSLEVRGFATPRWFDRKLLPNALVFSDCEGFERELFPPITTKAADSSTFVIEVHEAMAPGTRDALAVRFGGTHELTWVATHPEATVPQEVRVQLAGFSDAEVARLADELRGGAQEWLVAVPKG